MKMRKFWKNLTALLLAAVMVFSVFPVNAQAASSSEIRDQINDLKDEKKELQEELNKIRSQYQANEDEMADLVAQKNLIDQEISCFMSRWKTSMPRLLPSAF